jgi:hypothetical protein
VSTLSYTISNGSVTITSLSQLNSNGTYTVTIKDNSGYSYSTVDTNGTQVIHSNTDAVS